ncbi:2-hydroxyacyl-CoA dehydratase subunit D [Thermodesulfobacteriota bacterium]
MKQDSNGSFSKLQRHYHNRMDAARAFHAQGGNVIGLVGNIVPVEFIIAAGQFPLLIAGTDRQPIPDGDEYLEDIAEWEVRSVFDQVLKGECEFLDLLIVSRNYELLFYFLKEIVRQGRNTMVPPLHIYDMIQIQDSTVEAYNRNSTDSLILSLERLCGHPLDEDRLLAAVQITNRKRELTRKLLDLRQKGAVSGIEAMQAIGAGFFMHPKDYCEAMNDYLPTLKPDASISDRPRLLVTTSEPLHHLNLHEALESAGGLVVAEDDWWGTRSAGGDIDENGPLVETIHHKYHADTASKEIHPRAAREAWFHGRIQKGDIDAVIFYIPPADGKFGWDYPRLKGQLDKRGIPSLLIRDDVLDENAKRNVVLAATEFISKLHSPDAND